MQNLWAVPCLCSSHKVLGQNISSQMLPSRLRIRYSPSDCAESGTLSLWSILPCILWIIPIDFCQGEFSHSHSYCNQFAHSCAQITLLSAIWAQFLCLIVLFFCSVALNCAVSAIWAQLGPPSVWKCMLNFAQIALMIKYICKFTFEL